MSRECCEQVAKVNDKAGFFEGNTIVRKFSVGGGV